MAAEALTEPTSFVYVIGPNGGPLKIGVANDVDVRRAQIQVSQARPVTVLFSQGVPAHRRYDVEKHAHALLASKRTMGEWFAVSPRLAIKAVQTAANDIAAGKPAPAPSMHERMGGRGMRSEDGLTAQLRRGSLTRKQTEAALIYRRLFDTAQRDAHDIYVGGSPTVPPSRAAMDILSRISAAVTARVGARAAFMLVEVIGKGLPARRLGGLTVQHHRKRAELREALDVVADLLTGSE